MASILLPTSQWLRDRVREVGCEAVLVDAGIGEPQVEHADTPGGAEKALEAAPDCRLHDVGTVPPLRQA